MRMFVPLCQEWLGENERAMQSARNWRKEVAAAPAFAQLATTRASELVVPATLSLDAVLQLLPDRAGCYPFLDRRMTRVRVFYTNAVGSRLSTSCSLATASMHQACLHCLKWAWGTRAAPTG